MVAEIRGGLRLRHGLLPIAAPAWCTPPAFPARPFPLPLPLPRRPLRMVHSPFPRVPGTARCTMSKHPSPQPRPRPMSQAGAWQVVPPGPRRRARRDATSIGGDPVSGGRPLSAVRRHIAAAWRHAPSPWPFMPAPSRRCLPVGVRPTHPRRAQCRPYGLTGMGAVRLRPAFIVRPPSGGRVGLTPCPGDNRAVLPCRPPCHAVPCRPAQAAPGS